MCGIFAYVGKSDRSGEIVLEGLRLLEHRGYDSIGLSCFGSDKVSTFKISKKEKIDFSVADLLEDVKNFESSLAIGHNRWATFGEVSTINAHPHCDESGDFYLVQNGNVENLSEIETEIGSWNRKTETDTEAIVALIAKHHKNGETFVEAVKKTINSLEGSNAIVVARKSEADKLTVVNRGGTIILAKTGDGMIVVSDKAAFGSVEIKKYRILSDNEMAIVTNDKWEIFSTKEQKAEDDFLSLTKDTKDGFEHYMLKEIFEQPLSFSNAIRGRIVQDYGVTHADCMSNLGQDLAKAKTFHFVGCGTAYNACQYASLLLSRFGISARAWIASEFCYSHPVFDSSDAFVFVSQSGETADSIEVLKEIILKGNTNIGIVNVAGSRIWRETQSGIGIRAGKERGVASTKAYTSQLASIVILAVFLARQRNMTIDTGQKILRELETFPEKIEQILSKAEAIKMLAKKYKKYSNYFFLGRYFNSITAAEGSLKLKEISYVHAESYPLGEMKHGPLSLVDKNFCSIVIALDDSVFKKSLVNIQEIKAREGTVLAIVNEDKDLQMADDRIYIPKTLDYLSPILSVIPLQLFSYYMAVELGKNPDKPRNLAKTVTVI